jgi:hypothetical protein
MSDTGVSEHAANPVIASSHTGTQQWQSFEIRMRHRRAERCRLRAEVAIEAGFLDDAREALDEARGLQPDLPELIATDQRLAEAERPVPPVPVEQRRGIGARGPAVAAAMILAVGFAGWLMSGESSSLPGSAATPASNGASRDRAPAPPGTTEARAPVVPAQLTAPTPIPDERRETAAAEAAREPATMESDREPQPATTPPVVAAVPSIEGLPPPAARPSETAALAPATMPSADVPVSPPPEMTPALPPPSTPPPSAAAPNSAPESAGPADGDAADANVESKVRAALSHYESAYSRLDAAAARAVWPSVDAGALGRAFDSLQSQQVSLGRCSVSLGVNRQSARASCAGTAMWTPKVGGGARTEPRRWTFDLEVAGDRWQIVRATAR